MPLNVPEPLRPTEAESQSAQIFLEQLSPLLSEESSDFRITSKSGEVKLPPTAVKIMVDALRHLAEGRPVSVVSPDTDLTTQQAADILNVSRPYVVKLLEAGDIPFSKVGRHRRIRLEDLMDYKRRNDEERERAFDELVAQAQELDMGY